MTISVVTVRVPVKSREPPPSLHPTFETVGLAPRTSPRPTTAANVDEVAL